MLHHIEGSPKLGVHSREKRFLSTNALLVLHIRHFLVARVEPNLTLLIHVFIDWKGCWT